MARELHPRITLLEGHDKGGEVDHRLQLVPGFILGKAQRQRSRHTIGITIMCLL